LLSLPPVSTSVPTSDELPAASKVALILEAENEIRSLERDLREVEALEQRGIVGAGKLAGASGVLSRSCCFEAPSRR
jgi:hypothetical protein